jgi:ubiquitin-conjugating enzyme E2 S
MAVARIRKDIGSLYKSTPADIVLTEDTGANLESIRLQIKGPDGTPYHGGLWDLLIKVPSDYPTSPPKVYFQTKIFHPNVHPLTGEVCVDTLKRDWTSDLNLCHILLVS